MRLIDKLAEEYSTVAEEQQDFKEGFRKARALAALEVTVVAVKSNNKIARWVFELVGNLSSLGEEEVKD